MKEQLDYHRALLINTKLFSEVGLNIRNWDTSNKRALLSINVRELLYILPVPIFELADRNFNVWWNEQGRSLSRVDYGARLYLYNLTGRNDRLKLVAQFGFTRKWEVSYRLPYLNKARSLGIETGALYSTQKTIPFITLGNRRSFINLDDDRLLSRFRVGTRLFYRPHFFLFQDLRVEFYQNKVDERINTEFNPDFFKDARATQKFFNLVYTLDYDRRNVRVFATQGHRLEFKFTKQGFGVFDDIDLIEVSSSYSLYPRLSDRLSTAHTVKGKIELSGNQPPYFQNRALGFGTDYIRGYELYVLDGLRYAYLKNAFHFKLIDRAFNLGKSMPLRPLKKMPFTLFLSSHLDVGRVGDRFYQAENTLVDRWVYGYGAGIDILLYNNYLLEMDVSVNDLGEVGFFFQYNLDF